MEKLSNMIKSKRRLLFISLMVLLNIASFAQDSSLDRIGPPDTQYAPNAAEIGRYGKVPVSYFNGLPNITIPLTEVKGKGITVPIYLSYTSSVTYNALDLPLLHARGTGSTEWTYSYGGEKLREKVTPSSGTATVTDRVGDFVFTDGSLTRVDFPGGFADMTGSAPQYFFFLTDHLGSVRVVADAQGNVHQVNHYYPYGDRFADPRYTVTAQGAGADNGRLFAGKEQEKSSGLYDFEARFGNTFLGRFTTMDPMAEKHYSISPYAYCAGNPVNLVDPMGKSWYYSINNGQYLGQIDDGDDNIYMLTEDQIKHANGNYEIWQSLRDLDYFSNNFLQMGLNGELTESAAHGVIKDLFRRANHVSETGGEEYLHRTFEYNVILDEQPFTTKAEITSKKVTIYVRELYASPYDNISLFSHEIKHVLDKLSGLLTNNSYKINAARFEYDADAFSKEHWSYKKNNKQTICRYGISHQRTIEEITIKYASACFAGHVIIGIIYIAFIYYG